MVSAESYTRSACFASKLFCVCLYCVHSFLALEKNHIFVVSYIFCIALIYTPICKAQMLLYLFRITQNLYKKKKNKRKNKKKKTNFESKMPR